MAVCFLPPLGFFTEGFLESLSLESRIEEVCMRLLCVCAGLTVLLMANPEPVSRRECWSMRSPRLAVPRPGLLAGR